MERNPTSTARQGRRAAGKWPPCEGDNPGYHSPAEGRSSRRRQDEHPRATTVETLVKLGTPFKKEGGTVTAGNASGVNDGVAALITASEATARKFDLTPTAHILGIADDDSRRNRNGGTIALGHPRGMSGARTTGTAALELAQAGGRYSLSTMYIDLRQPYCGAVPFEVLVSKVIEH